MVTAFREHGHRLAKIDPLEATKDDFKEVPEILEKRYPTEESFTSAGFLHASEQGHISVAQGIQLLKEIYSNKVGYEFMYIEVKFD